MTLAETSMPTDRTASTNSPYAARGVDPPVTPICPPPAATPTSIAAHARAGSSRISISTGIPAEPSRRAQRGAVGGVAQQRLPHSLTEDSALPPGRSQHEPARLGSLRRAL